MKAFAVIIALLLVACEPVPPRPVVTVTEIGTCAPKTWSSGYTAILCAVKLSNEEYAVCEQPMSIGMKYPDDVKCQQ